MSYRVFIAGGYFHESDLAYLPGASELLIDGHRPGLTVIQDVDQYFADAAQADLAIFLTHGGKLDRFFADHGSRKSVQDFFRGSHTRKVMWSVDAHHLWRSEVRHQQHFDRMYVADTSVMKHYDQSKVDWLPCYFRYLSITDLIATNEKQRAPERSVVFPHHSYSVGNRNEVARQIREICDRKGLQSLFGEVGSEDQYLEVMRTSQVCLNVSLLSEVNLRTFEALAYNRVLLADWAPDYERISADWSSTLFYRRDLDSFEDRLDRALAIPLEEVRSMRSVVNQHMLTHRYLEIINRELGTKFQMDAVYPDVPSTPPSGIAGCLPDNPNGNLVARLRALFS